MSQSKARGSFAAFRSVASTVALSAAVVCAISWVNVGQGVAQTCPAGGKYMHIASAQKFRETAYFAKLKAAFGFEPLPANKQLCWRREGFSWFRNKILVNECEGEYNTDEQFFFDRQSDGFWQIRPQRQADKSMCVKVTADGATLAKCSSTDGTQRFSFEKVAEGQFRLKNRDGACISTRAANEDPSDYVEDNHRLYAAKSLCRSSSGVFWISEIKKFAKQTAFVPSGNNPPFPKDQFRRRLDIDNDLDGCPDVFENSSGKCRKVALYNGTNQCQSGQYPFWVDDDIYCVGYDPKADKAFKNQPRADISKFRGNFSKRSGGIYFADGEGHYCRYRTMADFACATGKLDGAGVQELSADQTFFLTEDNACSVDKGRCSCRPMEYALSDSDINVRCRGISIEVSWWGWSDRAGKESLNVCGMACFKDTYRRDQCVSESAAFLKAYCR